MIKRFFTLSAALLLLGVTFLPGQSQATTGQLVKVSGFSTVYYTLNGKSHLFHNERIFKRWFGDFSQVSIQTISGTELGNLTWSTPVFYPPGSLLKLPSDPKVYVVEDRGTLRWVTSEVVARELFGTNWNKRVDDFSEAFLPGYTFGAPIRAASDFTLSNLAISDVMTPPTTPSPTPTTPTPAPATSTVPTTPPQPIARELLIDLPVDPLRPLDNSAIRAFASPSTNLASIEISGFGGRTSCLSSPCRLNIQVPGDAASSYQIYATSTYQDGTRVASSATINIRDAQANAGRLEGVNTETRVGEPVFLTARWTDTGSTPSLVRIYANNLEIKTCYSTRDCRYTHEIASGAGTTTTYKAIFSTISTVNETDPQTTAFVANARPTITASLAQTVIQSGETTSIGIDVGDEDGIQSTELWVDGARFANCSTASCRITLGPWTSRSSHTIEVRATDRRGLETRTQLPTLNVLP